MLFGNSTIERRKEFTQLVFGLALPLNAASPFLNCRNVDNSN